MYLDCIVTVRNRAKHVTVPYPVHIKGRLQMLMWMFSCQWKPKVTISVECHEKLFKYYFYKLEVKVPQNQGKEAIADSVSI